MNGSGTLKTMKAATCAAIAGSLLFCFGATSLAAAPDLYIRAAIFPSKEGESVVEVVVGNRGGIANTNLFDAVMEVRSGATIMCRQKTNFVTPLNPGIIVKTFRFSVKHDKSAEPLSRYTVEASLRFLEGDSAGDSSPENNRHLLSVEFPRGKTECLALKPPQ